MSCQVRVNKEMLTKVEAVLNGDKDMAQELCSLSSEELKKVRKGIEIFHLLGNQQIPDESDIDSIDLITDLYADNGKFLVKTSIFSYGYIQGIRAERARRKGACK